MCVAILTPSWRGVALVLPLLLVIAHSSVAGFTEKHNASSRAVHRHAVSTRRSLDASSISSTRSGPDGNTIAVDLADASAYVPKGTALASAAGVTTVQEGNASTSGSATVHDLVFGRDVGAEAGLTVVSIAQGPHALWSTGVTMEGSAASLSTPSQQTQKASKHLG